MFIMQTLQGSQISTIFDITCDQFSRDAYKTTQAQAEY
jgi:hypothetical protein